MRDSSKFWLAAAQCLMGIGAVVLITFVCFRLHLSLMEPTFLYLIVIMLLSLRTSFLSTAVVSFIAVGCLDYYFVPPLFSFSLGDPFDIETVISFLTTSFVITHLVSRVRKLMQEKLQRSETYLAEAQRLSHTGSFSWKPADNRLVWSEETFRILQYETMTQPTLDQILQRIHPEDAVWVRPTLELAVQDGRDFDYEHRFFMPDGSVKHVHIVAHAKRDKRGELEFIGAVVDVTERRRAEEALRKAQANLAHVSRLTTLGELTASIAHEVNQPLGAVVTNANACLRWLDRAVPDLDEARDAARRIVRDGNRGAEVISRIRGMVKKDQPARVRLNVNDVVQEIIALTRMELQGATLQIELASELPPVAADRVQLQQVLLNLTMNALDAMKPVTDRPRVLRIGTEDHEGLEVIVTVQDSGVGLDSNEMRKLFETFYTTKPGGLGMGLSICRSIMEEHGGRLWAEPNNGPGATFRFSLPVGEVA